MFYYKYSKMTRRVIVFNAVLTLIIGLVHCYNVYRIEETTRIINEYRELHHVTRDTAIDRLTEAGVSLFIGNEFATYFGIVMTIVALILLYNFKSNNGFFITMTTAISCFLANIIGGILLFYLIFSHRLESFTSEQMANSTVNREKSDWEGFISNRAGKKT